MSREDSTITLKAALEGIATGVGSPVYVLVGDEFLCRGAVTELVAALVPESQRSLNVVQLDSMASTRQVADELSTLPMFRGTKVVCVQPAEFLAPKRAQGDAFERPRKLWEEGKQREAARRFLGLAARAGFPLEGLGQRSLADWTAAGLGMTSADRGWTQAAIELAERESLAVPDSDIRSLEELLLRGLPPKHHLVLAAEEVDRASSIFKSCLLLGREIPRVLPTTSTGPRTREASLSGLSAEILTPLGKRLEPAAERMLVSRIGEDARALASELMKLANYVGDRATVGVADVTAVVVEGPGEDYFALTNALESRDAGGMLRAIDDELARGSPPLKILGGLTSGMRGLLLARANLSSLGVSGRLTYPDFERRVAPVLAEADRKAGRKPGHPFRAFKRAEASLRFGPREIPGLICLLASADAGIKRGMDARMWLSRIAVNVGGHA
jgi:DNA polymerase III subunit delta